MASVLVSRVSRRFIKSSLPSSGPSMSLCLSIFNPSVSTESSVGLNPSLNPSFSNLQLRPTKQSHPQIFNFEFCKNYRLHSDFQFVSFISTSSSSVGGDSKESKNPSGNENKVGFSKANISWIDSYLPRQLQPYARLARLDKPIGTWLLLWPCMW